MIGSGRCVHSSANDFTCPGRSALQNRTGGVNDLNQELWLRLSVSFWEMKDITARVLFFLCDLFAWDSSLRFFYARTLNISRWLPYPKSKLNTQKTSANLEVNGSTDITLSTYYNMCTRECDRPGC